MQALFAEVDGEHVVHRARLVGFGCAVRVFAHCFAERLFERGHAVADVALVAAASGRAAAHALHRGDAQAFGGLARVERSDGQARGTGEQWRLARVEGRAGAGNEAGG